VTSAPAEDRFADGPNRAPSRSWLARAEALTCFAILALMSNALLAPVFAPDQIPDNVPWLRLIWLPVYAAIAVMLLSRPLQMGRVIVPGVLGMILVAWAFASSQWSIAPDVTFRRSIALMMTSLFGLYLAARYDWREMIELLAGVFLLLAAGSYIASLLFPGFGVHDTIHPGAWKSLWYEKNMMGAQMVVGLLAQLAAAVIAPRRRKLWIGGAVLCIGLVFLSTSTTALLGMLLVLGGAMALALVRRGGPAPVVVIWGGVAGLGAFLALILLAPEVFFGLIGKDPTLTGRTGIWEALFRRVELRPWLGYGFGAFWIDPWGPSWFIKNEVQWAAPNAHNGWLDILVQLGVVGLVLAAAHFLISVTAALSRIMGGPEAYWAVLFMVVFALFSVSESTVMQYNGISWVMYTATMAKLLQWRGFATGRAPTARTVQLFPDEEPTGMWGRAVR
jgi:exopolysaccharide production protein ExoQ